MSPFNGRMEKIMNIDELMAPGKHPIRVAQFGTGNFLRAFADYMIDVANEKRLF